MRIRSRAQAEAKIPEVYCAPLSVWKITPATSPPLVDLVATAMLTAAWASSAVGWRSDSAKPRRCPREQVLDGCEEHRALVGWLAASAPRRGPGERIC